MRFYHSLTLSVLIIIYLLSDNVLEAKPTTGSYQWLKCRPNSKNANCIEKKGPKIDLSGQPQRLPSRVAKDIDPVDSSEESREESGDGSGDLSNLIRKEREINVEELQKQIPIEEEGSAPDSDYSNYIAPAFVKTKLSAEDLREDNMIE